MDDSIIFCEFTKWKQNPISNRCECFGRKNHKIRNEWMIQLYFASSQSENKIQ
jgi:hypothetical protein